MSTSDEPPRDPVPPAPSGSGGPYGGSQGYGGPEGYGAPQGQPAGGPPADALAGFWIRFAGALVDGIVVAVVGGIIEAIIDGGALLGLVVGGAYFTYLHGSAAGQTVGNLVCGIRIVDANSGGTLPYGRALLRWLMSYVSGIALLIGYLWMLWDPMNQTWHDKVAQSYAVKTSHYPPPAPFGRPAS